jgi:hypothetical protein
VREELIELLEKQAGLDRVRAEHAADVALAFAKKRAPELLRVTTGPKGNLSGLLGN